MAKKTRTSNGSIYTGRAILGNLVAMNNTADIVTLQVFDDTTATGTAVFTAKVAAKSILQIQGDWHFDTGIYVRFLTDLLGSGGWGSPVVNAITAQYKTGS